MKNVLTVAFVEEILLGFWYNQNIRKKEIYKGVIVMRDDKYMTRANTIAGLAAAFSAEKVDANVIMSINSMWVAVSDRLPNKEECARSQGEFLVCRSDGKIYIDKFLQEGNGYAPRGFYILDGATEVVAWMNLPDPVKFP